MPEQSAIEMAEMLDLPPKRERAKPTPIAKLSEPLQLAPITFEVQLEMIDELAREYMPLAIMDVNNKEEVERVHAARMKCVKLRTGIDKKRKELNDPMVVRTRTVNSAAKTLTDALAPIEAHLTNEEGKVQREKERIEREAEEKRRAMIRSRLELMAAAGRVCVETDISYLSEDEFQSDLAKAVEAKRVQDEMIAAAAAEQDRINAENRAESARIAAEKADMERQRKEIADAQAKIDAANKAIADAEAAAARAAELEQAKRDAAEQARLDAIAEQERKAVEAKARAEADEVERKRQEELRPDREKIALFADTVAKLEGPKLSAKSKAIASEIAQIMLTASQQIRTAGSKLK